MNALDQAIMELLSPRFARLIAILLIAVAAGIAGFHAGRCLFHAKRAPLSSTEVEHHNFQREARVFTIAALLLHALFLWLAGGRW